MLFWIKYPFIRITISFCIGILIGNFNTVSFQIASAIALCCLLLYSLILFVLSKKIRKFNVLFGIISVLSTVFIGYTSVIFRNPEINPRHIINHQLAIEAYKVNVTICLKRTEKFKRVVGRIIAVKDNKGWRNAEGKILLYFPLSEEIKYGDQFIIIGNPDTISPPRNTGEFDYKSYLKHRKIYHTNFLRYKDYIRITPNPISFLKDLGENSRIWLTEKIKFLYSDSQTQGILLTLLTGQRDYIDRDTYNSFVDSGIIHILAVSGLHVGIIYFMVLGICYPFSDTLALRIIKWLFAICVLTFFAILTGLQASVLRAVLMFSLVHTGKIIKRDSNSLNSVSLSAFILLLINPDFLFFVGFQLSYSAVFGILLKGPIIKRMYATQHRITKWLWNFASISFAAQLATLPLTMYYFKQFPLYFILSNYIAIPYASLTLFLGFISVLTLPIQILRPLIPFILEFITKIFLQFIYQIKELPLAVISPINIGIEQSILLFLTIFLIYYGISKKKISTVLSGFILLALVILIDIYAVIISKHTKELLVYNISGISCIELVSGDKSIMLTADPSEKSINAIHYHTQGNINLYNRKTEIHDMQDIEGLFPAKYINGVSIFVWENLIIGILQEKPLRNINTINTINLDFLIIRNNLLMPDDINNYSFYSKKFIWDTSNRNIHQNYDTFAGSDSIHMVSYHGFYRYSVKKF